VSIHIGTSGFSYRHWHPKFYDGADEFGRYSSVFGTVELNVTFYRMPAAATFQRWAALAPEGFTFAVKASRFLTHVRRLRDPAEPVRFMLERARLLGPHLGPVLLQLPPDMEVDLDLLEETLAAFPGGLRVVVEPRHASWFVEDLRQLLTAREAALCWADRRGALVPLWRTADWGYLRFHEGRATPKPCYGEAALALWAERIKDAWGPQGNVYAYFNNDRRGCALRDAAAFGRLAEAAGLDTLFPILVGDDVLT
jgi:uncharacterized protein YecE (DUF72 family)